VKVWSSPIDGVKRHSTAIRKGQKDFSLFQQKDLAVLGNPLNLSPPYGKDFMA
jgi:hypothetical protein